MLEKFKKVLVEQLKQGTSPDKVAMSVAIGVLVGCFPLLGVTTLLTAGLAYLFRLNQIVAQATNYLMYPVQLLMIPVYIKVVCWLFSLPEVTVRPDLIIKEFFQDPMLSLRQYGLISVYAVGLWAVVSLVLFYFLNRIILIFVNKTKK